MKKTKQKKMDILIIGDNNFWYDYSTNITPEQAIAEVKENLKLNLYEHDYEPTSLHIFEIKRELKEVDLEGE